MMHERIKQVRKAIGEHGKTQESFANYLGISKQNLSSYEIGRRTPSDAVIRLICDKFNVNEDWLRTGEGEMFVNKSLEQELIDFTADMLLGGDDFKKRLISGLAKFTDEQWDMLESLIDVISQQKRE